MFAKVQLAAAIALVAGAAHANHYDVGGSIGISDYDTYSEEFAASDRASSFAVTAGYQALDNVKIELRYMDLGSTKKASVGKSIKTKSKAAAVGVVFEAPMASLSDRTTFFLRADAVHMRTKGEFDDGTGPASLNGNRVVPALGLGFMYQLTPTVKGRIQYERIFNQVKAGKNQLDSDIDQISLSVHKSL